jgi:hypothetical protein
LSFAAGFLAAELLELEAVAEGRPEIPGLVSPGTSALALAEDVAEGVPEGVAEGAGPLG